MLMGDDGAGDGAHALEEDAEPLGGGGRRAYGGRGGRLTHGRSSRCAGRNPGRDSGGADLKVGHGRRFEAGRAVRVTGRRHSRPG